MVASRPRLISSSNVLMQWWRCHQGVCAGTAADSRLWVNNRRRSQSVPDRELTAHCQTALQTRASDLHLRPCGWHEHKPGETGLQKCLLWLKISRGTSHPLLFVSLRRRCSPAWLKTSWSRAWTDTTAPFLPSEFLCGSCVKNVRALSIHDVVFVFQWTDGLRKDLHHAG